MRIKRRSTIVAVVIALAASASGFTPATPTSSDVASAAEASNSVPLPNLDMTRVELVRSLQGMDRFLWQQGIFPDAEGEPGPYAGTGEPGRSLSIVRAELMTAFGSEVAGVTADFAGSQVVGVTVNTVPGSQVATLGAEGLEQVLSPAFGEARASLAAQGIPITVAEVADQGFTSALPLWDALLDGTLWSEAGFPADTQAMWNLDPVSGRVEISIAPEFIDRLEAQLVPYGDVATVDEMLGQVEFSIGVGRMPLSRE
jgi:hypothetical protein